MNHITDEEKAILEQQRIERLKYEAFIDGMRHQKSLQKELSDAEIYKSMNETLPTIMNNMTNDHLLAFARAIIKASRGEE